MEVLDKDFKNCFVSVFHYAVKVVSCYFTYHFLKHIRVMDYVEQV